jgi:hypothetical protein
VSDEITLEEVLKLVSFIKDDFTGKWHVDDVEGRVVGYVGGDIGGTVWGSIWRDVVGSVSGDVMGDIGGKVGGQVFGGPPPTHTRVACDDTGTVHVTKAR